MWCPAQASLRRFTALHRALFSSVRAWGDLISAGPALFQNTLRRLLHQTTALRDLSLWCAEAAPAGQAPLLDSYQDSQRDSDSYDASNLPGRTRAAPAPAAAALAAAPAPAPAALAAAGATHPSFLCFSHPMLARFGRMEYLSSRYFVCAARPMLAFHCRPNSRTRIPQSGSHAQTGASGSERAWLQTLPMSMTDMAIAQLGNTQVLLSCLHMLRLCHVDTAAFRTWIKVATRLFLYFRTRPAVLSSHTRVMPPIWPGDTTPPRYFPGLAPSHCDRTPGSPNTCARTGPVQKGQTSTAVHWGSCWSRLYALLLFPETSSRSSSLHVGASGSVGEDVLARLEEELRLQQSPSSRPPAAEQTQPKAVKPGKPGALEAGGHLGQTATPALGRSVLLLATRLRPCCHGCAVACASRARARVSLESGSGVSAALQAPAATLLSRAPRSRVSTRYSASCSHPSAILWREFRRGSAI